MKKAMKNPFKHECFLIIVLYYMALIILHKELLSFLKKKLLLPSCTKSLAENSDNLFYHISIHVSTAFMNLFHF